MKVKDLISILETKDLEQEILTPGFDEQGVCEIEIKELKVRKSDCEEFAPYQTYYEYEELGAPIDCYLIDFKETK